MSKTVTLSRQDLKAVVVEAINETVPVISDERVPAIINEMVPPMIDEAINRRLAEYTIQVNQMFTDLIKYMDDRFDRLEACFLTNDVLINDHAQHIHKLESKSSGRWGLKSA